VSVDRIQNAILGDAQKEAERIKHAAQKKADKRYEAAERELKAEFEQRVRAAEQNFAAKKNRAIVTLRAKLSMELLAEKNEVIDTIFEQAIDNVTKLADDGYYNLLLGWLKQSAPPEACELALNARDAKAFGNKLADAANAERDENAKIKLAGQPVDIRGGLVVRTFKYEIDRTLENTVANLKDQHGPEIAAKLFGGRKEKVEL